MASSCQFCDLVPVTSLCFGKANNINKRGKNHNKIKATIRRTSAVCQALRVAEFKDGGNTFSLTVLLPSVSYEFGLLTSNMFCADFTNHLQGFDKIRIPLPPGVRGKRSGAPRSFLIWTKLLVAQYCFPYEENRKDGAAIRIHLLSTQPLLGTRHVKINRTLAVSLRCSRLGREIRHGSRI